MSTLAFGAMTGLRGAAEPGESTDKQPPGLKTYVDSLAALVPAEVLAAHAAILTFTTQSVKNQTGMSVPTITSPGVLKGAFWALIGLSMFLYFIGRLGSIGGGKSKWDRWDFLRILIPPLAFIGWTMIQSPTAFDAAGPHWSMALRDVTALVGAIALAAVAAALAYKADQKPKPILDPAGAVVPAHDA